MINKKIYNNIIWKDDFIHSMHHWIESWNCKRINLRIYFSHEKPESCLEMNVKCILYDICIKVMKKSNDLEIYKILNVNFHIKLNWKVVNWNFILLLKKIMKIKWMIMQLKNIYKFYYIKINSFNFYRLYKFFYI